MNLTPATPEPTPDDIARGLAELERHLSEQAPPATLTTPVPPVEAEEQASAETRRVRQLRAEVAEARQLVALQDDDTPLIVESARVRRLRQAAHEAGRLAELAQDPAMRAYQSMRVRRLLVAVALASLTLALAWSTAGVQRFASDGEPAGSPAWWFAWLVEPFLSLGLLVVVGARAYLGTRGQALDDPTLVKVERLFLALTVGMNAWPYLPIVAEKFSVARLVLHILGPVVAVAVVSALPIILAAFTRLDHHPGTGVGKGLTGPSYRPNTADNDPDDPFAGNPELAALAERVRQLIATEDLPAAPSAAAIRRELRCGMDTARALRDALTTTAPSHDARGGEHG